MDSETLGEGVEELVVERVVGEDATREAVLADDEVEQHLGRSRGLHVERRHGDGPSGEHVDDHEDVFEILREGERADEVHSDDLERTSRAHHLGVLAGFLGALGLVL